MNFDAITVAALATISTVIGIGGIILYAVRVKDKNPAQWKTVKQTWEWFDIDPKTGIKTKRTRIEFSRVRI